MPFQINAHFTDAHPPGHRGETRRQRLAEFGALNLATLVLCLPEGSGLRVTVPHDGTTPLSPQPAARPPESARIKDVFDTTELLSSATVTGAEVAYVLRAASHCHVEVTTLAREWLSTDFLSIEVPSSDPNASQRGIDGRLSGIGARPTVTGLLSDSDGAVVAIAAAFKLRVMTRAGDVLRGNVRIRTHIPARRHAAASPGAHDALAVPDARNAVS